MKICTVFRPIYVVCARKIIKKFEILKKLLVIYTKNLKQMPDMYIYIHTGLGGGGWSGFFWRYILFLDLYMKSVKKNLIKIRIFQKVTHNLPKKGRKNYKYAYKCTYTCTLEEKRRGITHFWKYLLFLDLYNWSV